MQADARYQYRFESTEARQDDWLGRQLQQAVEGAGTGGAAAGEVPGAGDAVPSTPPGPAPSSLARTLLVNTAGKSSDSCPSITDEPEFSVNEQLIWWVSSAYDDSEAADHP